MAKNILRFRSGFSVLEILVALAIGLAGLVAFTGAITSANKLTKKSLSAVDIASIKRNVYAAVNCEATFRGLTQGSPCSGSARYIDLLSSEGKVVVSSTGSSSGNFVVRAYCSDGANGGLDVRIVKLKPDYISNTQDISWIGLSSPANPSHYMPDESRSSVLSYDWKHPRSILSTPGPGGLCSANFQNNTSAGSCQPNEYVQQINFDTREVKCLPIPTCNDTQSLEFSDSGFYCSSDRYTNMVTYMNQYADDNINATRDGINFYKNQANTYMDTVYNRFSKLGTWENGTTTSVGGSNDDQCSKLARGTCPDGYFMYGYEARQQGNGGCRSSCVKIAPP